MQNAMDKLNAQMADRYGDESIMRLRDMPVRPPVTSGSIALDFATGIGGLPSDRMVEVAGKQQAGKTTLGLLSMSKFLDAQPDRSALIIDAEHKLTKAWCERLLGSARMDRVALAWPDHLEQATDIYMDYVGSGNISFVLFDSIGGSPSMRVTEKSAERGNVGGNSIAVTRFANLAAGACQKYHSLLFGINQVRQDMEGFHRHMVPGGEAWKHHCVLRLLLRRSTREIVEDVVDGEKIPVGFKVIVKVVKNQLGAEGRTANYWLYNVETEKYGFGIDTLEETIRLGILTQVIEQRGAFYSHELLPGGKVQGRDALVAAVKADEPIRVAITNETMARLKQDSSLVAQIAPMDPNIEVVE